jgi:hypothetical protein
MNCRGERKIQGPDRDEQKNASGDAYFSHGFCQLLYCVPLSDAGERIKFLADRAALAASRSQGDPWRAKSNQSMTLTSSPLKSRESFSTTWGGEKGASPMVRQRRTIADHESFDMGIYPEDTIKRATPPSPNHTSAFFEID